MGWGVTAEVYWGWVEIHKFWFHEEYRGKGLGSKLLAQAEIAAQGMGAKKALLTTYSFQARTFYEERGRLSSGGRNKRLSPWQ